MGPFIVAGLGNPGARYTETRHNVGFRVVDRLCSTYRCRLREGPGPSLLARGTIGGEEVVLLQPQTFMNASGPAVADVLQRFDAPLERLLVIVDDVALPLGSLRLRPRGSDGGHNGLFSVIQHLQSEAIPRLRCGIGQDPPPPRETLALYVLSRFEETEREPVEAMIMRAADVVSAFVTRGIERTMTTYNT
jgi:PTH1 family peptidyl-tRNA hydrolase